ncbi:MAG: M20/M25/M40 family metallo-hydrolase [Chloroflexi bacterium]|nr:M20/M25/M40 family metallo-hydrolase [Chloroflexota bacterium]
MVYNGHYDTFPDGDRSLWTVDPFGGVVEDGKIYAIATYDFLMA